MAEKLGRPPQMVRTTEKVNNERKLAMAQKVSDACGGSVEGKIIAILGLTFKAGTDDVRESPALTIIGALQKAGARIRAYDPKGMENARAALKGVEYADSVGECLDGADVVTIVTEWEEFREALEKRTYSIPLVNLRMLLS